MERPKYDKEAVYDAKIAPLMNQIIELCKENQLPMIATFCYATRENEDVEELDEWFCSTAVPGPDNWVPERFDEARIMLTRDQTQMLAFTITKRKEAQR